MVYIGILWNSINDFKENVIEDINKHAKILDWCEIELNEQYGQFVKDVYKFDGIAEWKVDLKLQYMYQSNNTKVVVLFIEIDDKEIKYNELKKKNVIVNIENLKQYIRTKYSEKIDNYYFDNIFHMTDDKEELKNILIVLKNWSINIKSYIENSENSQKKYYLKGRIVNEN